jgi:DNA-directed RNA polymerase sigma subunit (sigma70/sigma32)
MVYFLTNNLENNIGGIMADNNEKQALFMEALNSLKEYAKVNCGVVTKDDVRSYFKEMDMDESKFQMVYGYLMANNIKITGEDGADNEFLKMMESAVAQKQDDDNIYETQKDNEEDTQASESNNGVKLYADINVMPEKENNNDNQSVIERLEKLGMPEGNDNLNYDEDEKYLELYLEDLKEIEELSDTTRAYLLMNIVEDNDKDSLDLLSKSFLEKIVDWVEPFRRRGVLASDLVQEANLAMMAYIKEKRWSNNSQWIEKIKEGTTNDLLEVLSNIESDVRYEVIESLFMLLDEQIGSSKVANKVLNKVNLVNDWAVRLKEELGRKPTVEEIAENMGVSKEHVMEAIQLSAENIEVKDTKKQN